MALDTRRKRSSALAVRLPFLLVGTLPLADGSLDAGDRAQGVQMYWATVGHLRRGNFFLFFG
jgi:hypothetical protein